MTQEQICILISIVVYLGGMLFMGFCCVEHNKDASDFYLGGRQLGPLVTAMSAEASDMSSWLLMGLPGVAYLAGICEPVWTALGLGIGTYFNWLIVSKRLRHYSVVCGNAVTVPEFFEKRFKDKSHLLTAIAAVVIVVFFVPYTASGFNACGTLFSSLFGVDYFTAMVISAVVIVAYTALGGFLAASTTDFVQSIVMSVALICILCFGFSTVGGAGAVMQQASAMEGYLSLIRSFDVTTGASKSYSGLLGIVSTLAWGLGYFGMPHILLRFMAIRDPKELKIARRVGTAWVFIAMGVAIIIGMVAMTMTSQAALPDLTGNGSTSSQRAIIEMANLLATHGIVPALLAGVVMAGILACTMSTCDSQLLAAASSVSQDILQGVFGMKISQRANLIIARATLVIIGLLGIWQAREEGSVFAIVSFAWAGFGASFGPVMLCSLFWKRANRWGALAGMIGGGAMVFIWKYMIAPMGGVFAIYELLPAFIVGLALCVVVSLVTGEPDAVILTEFEKAKALDRMD